MAKMQKLNIEKNFLDNKINKFHIHLNEYK